MDYTVTFSVQVTANSPEEAAAYALDDLRDETLGPWFAKASCSRGAVEVQVGGVDEDAPLLPDSSSSEHAAFEVVAEDVESVLRENILRITDSKGLSIEAMAEFLLPSLDAGRIEKAALDGGVELVDQAAAARAEILAQLTEAGHLKA